jgi:hypothetical protein
MKYAFVLGTSAFIVPHNAIYYGDKENSKEFLRINSIYHDNAPGSFLAINLNIKDTDGKPVVVHENQPVPGAPYSVQKEQNSVKVLRADSSLIIHIHQLDDDAAMGLEHNIVAELEVNMPVVVIRIFGEFLVDSLHVSAENEKLYINHNGYATSALAGEHLLFTADGVVL